MLIVERFLSEIESKRRKLRRNFNISGKNPNLLLQLLFLRRFHPICHGETRRLNRIIIWYDLLKFCICEAVMFHLMLFFRSFPMDSICRSNIQINNWVSRVVERVCEMKRWRPVLRTLLVCTPQSECEFIAALSATAAPEGEASTWTIEVEHFDDHSRESGERTTIAIDQWRRRGRNGGGTSGNYSVGLSQLQKAILSDLCSPFCTTIHSSWAA